MENLFEQHQDNSNKIKMDSPVFFCEYHPKERIERINYTKVREILVCIQCFLDHDIKTKDFKTLDEFFKDIQKELQHHKKITIDKEIPEKYIKILEKGAYHLEKVKKSINAQREHLEKIFEELEKNFIMSIRQYKTNLIERLESNLENLKSNLDDFSTRLKEIFNTDSRLDNFETKNFGETIWESYQNCKNTKDLDELIRSIRNYQIQEGLNSVHDTERIIMKKLEHVAESNEKSFNLRPEVFNLYKINIDELFSKSWDSCKPFFDQKFDLAHQITTISLYDSKSQLAQEILQKPWIQKRFFQNGAKNFNIEKGMALNGWEFGGIVKSLYELAECLLIIYTAEGESLVYYHNNNLGSYTGHVGFKAEIGFSKKVAQMIQFKDLQNVKSLTFSAMKITADGHKYGKSSFHKFGNKRIYFTIQDYVLCSFS